MEKLQTILTEVENVVWGIPLIVMVLFTGLLLTIRLKGLQLTKLVLAIKHMFKNDSEGTGEVSSFGALCTALSATIGTGNIVGVATAIAIGGPGALFWMWFAAALGTATKYAECLLALKYRVVAEDGHIVGGPFYYIENGMGKKFKWLAKVFAFLGVCTGLFGIGTFTQINGITTAVNTFFDPKNSNTVTLFGQDYSWSVIVAGLILTICVALVLIGGLKRISKVAEFIVPFMAIIYIVAVIIIIGSNITKIPDAIVTVIKGAFDFRPAAGGIFGAMFVAMQKGIERGIFSNEAGIGSAPIAAAAAKTEEPVEQGLVSMLGTVIDTLIICTMTGLCIIVTDAYKFIELEGSEITTKAFQIGMPFSDEFAAFTVMICLVFFAFTTILGWNYYSERCLDYLTGNSKKAVIAFKWAYILCVFIGPYMTVEAVWTIASIFNGLMAIPNLIALIALSGVVAATTKEYFSRKSDKMLVERRKGYVHKVRKGRSGRSFLQK